MFLIGHTLLFSLHSLLLILNDGLYLWVLVFLVTLCSKSLFLVKILTNIFVANVFSCLERIQYQQLENNGEEEKTKRDRGGGTAEERYEC